MNKWISGVPKQRGNLLFREMGHCHLEVHSNGSTWTIDQSALNLQSDNHVGVQIRCGTGKSAESASILSIGSHCLHFCQEKSLIIRWPKSHLFVTEMFFNVEILQFWENLVVQAISASKFVLHDPCCSSALVISGILVFSRSSSFFYSRFLFFQRKSTQKLTLYHLGVWPTRWPLGLGLVSASEESQRFEFFSKK